jgi:hypothetical protein
MKGRIGADARVQTGARTGANHRAHILAAQRGCEPAGRKPVDNLHPLDMAGGRHHLQKHAFEGRRALGFSEVGGLDLANEPRRLSLGSTS